MRVTKEYTSDKNRTTELAIPKENILIVLVLVTLKQTVMPKSMASHLGWFDRDQTKFEDWWREIYLFLKSNRVTVTNDKIKVVLV